MADDGYKVPKLALGALFLKFLRFGLLAWGGPVAQIALLRQELVEEERWISREQFNRALAVYQALPGPEAHELCVYFGMLSRGRPGAVLAGLGFMLPGFLLMFGLSAVYVRFGLSQPWVASAFAAVQAAVAALIVRAIVRIGEHALVDGWLWTIGVICFVAELCGVHFGFALGASALAYLLTRSRAGRVGAALVLVALVAGAVLWAWRMGGVALALEPVASGAAMGGATPLELLISGLRTGLLTFGGAYTAIPFLQADAVTRGGWMTNTQFLDGLALGGVLPAPLIIFSTFVGYLSGGPFGALMMTSGVFLPAFLFTLLGHSYFERIIQNERIKRALDGVAAGVVGLIAATSVGLLRTALTSWTLGAVFVTALAALFAWKGRWSIPVMVFSAAAIGLLLHAR